MKPLETLQKMCKHCRKYFIKLDRKCTLNAYGECDCPRCQGICECEDIVRALEEP